MAATLAQALQPAMVDAEEINRDYAPLVALVRELIGVIPNCNPIFEIWPPGFRTFNVLVPNLLNLPGALFGQGAPKSLVGLAMFVSSRESGCMYCTAHHCSFAIRRGASIETVVDGEYSDAEAIVAEVARSAARIPGELTLETYSLLGRHLAPSQVEWVVLAVAMGGFLNKFMDSMGIELERDTIADVAPLIGDRGWSPGKHLWDDELPVAEPNGGIPTDGMGTVLRVMRRAPGAIRFDAKFTKGVSGRIGPALVMLEERLGYAFPILASLQHKRAVRALATALRDNLDAHLSVVGLRAKILAGLVYAKIVDDEVLTAESVQLAQLLAPGLPMDLLAEIGNFSSAASETSSLPAGLSKAEAGAVILARAASTSPSDINEITIAAVTEHLTPPEIVEVVVWLSILQMLHRLYVFYDAKLGLT
jgi:alkylhydroperoxidase family enzyme